MSTNSSGWRIFHGDHQDLHEAIERLPEPPTWRPFGKDPQHRKNRRELRGATFSKQIRVDTLDRPDPVSVE